MRIIWTAGLLAAGVAGAGPARAADVTGGELRFGYERLAGGEGPRDETASKTSLEGAMAFGFGDRFGGQVDLGLDRFNLAEDFATAVGLHGFYNISPMTKVGGFAGYERVDGAAFAYWGGEVGVDTGVTEIEGFVLAGTETDSDASGLIYGLDGAQAVTPRLSLGGRIALGTFEDDLDMSRVAVTAAYDLTPSAEIEAELGMSNTDVRGLGARDDAFVGVRARVTFGPGQGAVFDRRGLLDLIPGG